MKYIKDHGIYKNNPVSYNEKAVPFPNRASALAVIIDPRTCHEEDIVVTPDYKEAITLFHEVVEPEIVVEGMSETVEPEIVVEGMNETGDDSSVSLEQLHQILASYEVPGGLLSKLLGLQRFEAAEIIVDDSLSMTAKTDAKGPKGETLTRWEEAKLRISQMVELMAYVRKCPPVTVTFLNKSETFLLQRAVGETPQTYLTRADEILTEAFRSGPSGTTPALGAIHRSLSRYSSTTPVLRYFFGDGNPDGGASACRSIEQLLLHRPHPDKNPFTFLSCTNKDNETIWMKECEEIAPFCSEFDDYLDESREVLRDQGKAFPYSFGMYFVAQIVAAFSSERFGWHG